MGDTRLNRGGGTAQSRRLTPLVGRGELLDAAQAQISAWLQENYYPAQPGAVVPSTAEPAEPAARDPAESDTPDPAAGKEPLAARNRLLVLMGPPAVGKSRLAYEVVLRLAERLGINTATAHCSESASLSAFAAEVAQIAGVDRANLPARWEQLCRHAAGVVGEAYAERVRRHLPLLALLLDCGAVDTAGIRQADTGSFIPGVKLALRACCELVAHYTGKPVVLVIEDLQWMGALREVIADLLRHSHLPQPLVVIGTARPEFNATPELLAGLAGIEGAESAANCDETTAAIWRALELPPLSRLEGARLVREVVPRLKLSAELEEELARKAAGLPYYYEEFARLLLSRQLVIDSADQPGAVADISGLNLPEGLAELIQNRLAGLDPDLRKLTGRASVIGRSFSGVRLRKLEAGLGLTDSARTVKGLAALEQHQLLASDAGDRYFFEHALTREAAYAMIPGAERIEMHEAMAASLEEMLIPGTASEWDILPELIRHQEGCEHYLNAHERVCELLLLMTTYHRSGDWDVHFARALQLWELEESASREAARQSNGHALPAAGNSALPPSPAIHLALCQLHKNKGDSSLAREHAGIALDLAAGRFERKYKARALLALGELNWDGGMIDEARTCFEEGLTTARKLGEGFTECAILICLGKLYGTQANTDKARDYFWQCLHRCRELGNRAYEAAAIASLAGAYKGREGWEAAIASWREAIVILREIGDLRGVINASLNIVAGLMWTGRTEEAWDLLQEHMATVYEVDDLNLTARVVRDLGELEEALGRVEEARKCFINALELARKVGNRHLEQSNLSLLGQLQLKSGELAAARNNLAQALDICSELESTSDMCVLYVQLARYYAAVASEGANTRDAEAALASARQSLAKAEQCVSQIGSPFNKHRMNEIERAHELIKNLEKEQGS